MGSERLRECATAARGFRAWDHATKSSPFSRGMYMVLSTYVAGNNDGVTNIFQLVLAAMWSKQLLIRRPSKMLLIHST